MILRENGSVLEVTTATGETGSELAGWAIQRGRMERTILGVAFAAMIQPASRVWFGLCHFILFIENRPGHQL